MSDIKPEWKMVVERKHPPLFMDFLLRAQTKTVFERATGLAFALTNVRKVKLGLYVDSNEMQALMRKMNERYESEGGEFFGDFAKRCHAACKALLETGKRIGAKAHIRLSNEVLIEDLREYDKRVLNVGAFLESIIAAQWVLEKLFDEMMSAQLSAINLADRKEELKGYLSIPSEENFVVQSIRELNQLAVQIQASDRARKLFEQPTVSVAKAIDLAPEIAHAIDDYVARFGWMKPLYYSGRPAERVDVVARLQKALQTDCQQKVAVSREQQRKASERFSEAMRLISDDEKLANLVAIIREYLHLRTYRLDVFFIANNFVLGLLDEIAERIGVDYEELIFLSVDEIVDSLLRQKSAVEALAKERRKAFAVSMRGGVITWYSGQALDRYLASEWEEAKPSAELRGVVACRGRAKGVAKILLENADMVKMQDGDILVTTMTTPNFMEAIEKASGIVTSEGGMLCHAAIVSRELGLPCVIGTQRATEVFSDGDVLEVIAEGPEGIVRRIS